MFFCRTACLLILFDQKQFEMAFIGSFRMHGIEDLFSRTVEMRMRMIHLVVYGTSLKGLQDEAFAFLSSK